MTGNSDTDNSVFINQGNGRAYTEQQFGSGDDITYWLGLGDLNGDNMPDVAVANSDGQNKIYFNQLAE